MMGNFLIFTYGTLKRGFPNYTLIEDISSEEDGAVSHLGTYTTDVPYPLVIGPNGIPFLVALPGEGHRVKGELYSLSARGLARVDELEGTTRGHYERLPVRVVKTEGDGVVVEAEAYFADKAFGERMWARAGRVGLGEYGPEEAKGYVRPNERLIGSSFLADVSRFIDE